MGLGGRNYHEMRVIFDASRVMTDRAMLDEDATCLM